VTVVETRVSVWEALAGRAPGQPAGPADVGLWHAVAERLNPARARPSLRTGIEAAELTSVRGVAYVMLRSPDSRGPCYLRLTPDEWALAQLMDGTRTVARLVAEFAKISGRLAPDRVTRVVADLAGNHMLEELPVDAFRQLDRRRRRPWPARFGRGLLAFARGRRLVLARIDPLVTVLYKAGGRLLFTRVVACLLAVVALLGLGVFGWTWWRGEQQVFLAHGSYARGALILLGLNVLALACHELGHGLAVKHAGRRVPAAGFLVYFGIPSVFVDTTDVWLAGRRARLVTTAAGPAAGLFLAGAAQLVGLADPALAPWCFKLSFAWYVNVAFNLNPFLALDGYYLLMDWLEIPNLRARGLTWVLAQLRRRPPGFGALDREGRLIALYGMLSLIWLVIGLNIAYRIYVDRVSGLVTGLWFGGWWQRGLLALVAVGLAAPAVWALVAWLGRRGKRMARGLVERRHSRDLPRRAAALRTSVLGRLPGTAVDSLAAQARWVHPRTGSPLVFAGVAQASVFVVVDGALEARRPGDPAGTVRERVGAGGVVGLGSALTGAPPALSWFTAGTTLLALPAAATASAVGPVAGPPPAERAELDDLLDRSPAFTGLSTEDRLALVAQARAVAVPPGGVLPVDEDSAALLASGTVVLPAGGRGPGDLVGSWDGAAIHARTPVRAWLLPAGAVSLLPAPPDGPAAGGQGPAFGVHPPGGYPPLAAPPGPPPEVPDETDRRFERKLWWLLLLLLLLALLATGANLFYPGPAWGEMPADRALLTVSRGSVAVVIDGRAAELHRGDQRYVGEGDTVTVARRSTGQLIFRGGGLAVLCGQSALDVGTLVSTGERPVAPAAALTLTAGRLLADTRSTSRAYQPLALTVQNPRQVRASDGVARFAVDSGYAQVQLGTVLLDGTALPVTDAPLTCGDGESIPRPAPSTTPSPTPSPSDSPSPPPSDSASPSAVPSTPPAPTTPGRTPTKTPTTTPTKTPTTTPPTSATPTNNAPVITWANGGDPGGGTLDTTYGTLGCNGQRTTILYEVSVTDDHDTQSQLSVVFSWSGKYLVGTKKMGIRGSVFYADLGPFTYQQAGNGSGDNLTIKVTATDSGGKSTTITGKPVSVLGCNIIG
jgi:putative peptide zinc metalloprotease protein